MRHDPKALHKTNCWYTLIFKLNKKKIWFKDLWSFQSIDIVIPSTDFYILGHINSYKGQVLIYSKMITIGIVVLKKKLKMKICKRTTHITRQRMKTNCKRSPEWLRWPKMGNTWTLQQNIMLWIIRHYNHFSTSKANTRCWKNFTFWVAFFLSSIRCAPDPTFFRIALYHVGFGCNQANTKIHRLLLYRPLSAFQKVSYSEFFP